MHENIKAFASRENKENIESKERDPLPESFLIDENHVFDENFSPIQLSDSLQQQYAFSRDQFELSQEQILPMLIRSNKIIFQPVVGTRGVYYKEGESPVFTQFGTTLKGAIEAVYRDEENNMIFE